MKLYKKIFLIILISILIAYLIYIFCHNKTLNILVLGDGVSSGQTSYNVDGLSYNDYLKRYFESEKLQEMGVDFKIGQNEVIVNKCDNLKAVDVTTLVYPGFPTDLGQPMSVLLTQAEGISKMEETIWESRIGHYPYLSKMGADIKVEGLVATIKGKTALKGTEINATDLRGGAALILAGLIAEGTTNIYDIDYILRGYENIINKLSNVGAKISLEEI